jgi:hypothetical protein
MPEIVRCPHQQQVLEVPSSHSSSENSNPQTGRQSRDKPHSVRDMRSLKSWIDLVDKMRTDLSRSRPPIASPSSAVFLYGLLGVTDQPGRKSAVIARQAVYPTTPMISMSRPRVHGIKPHVHHWYFFCNVFEQWGSSSSCSSRHLG